MNKKELKNINELLNINDNDCFTLHFDYEVISYYKWLYDEEGFFSKCIYPYVIVKIHNQELLDKLNAELEIKFVLDEEIKVTYDFGMEIQKFLMGKGKNGCISSEKLDNNEECTCNR